MASTPARCQSRPCRNLPAASGMPSETRCFVKLPHPSDRNCRNDVPNAGNCPRFSASKPGARVRRRGGSEHPKRIFMESVSPLSSPSIPIVLIVEDHEDTREMYHVALQDAGYRVVDAPEARDALSCATDILPDVIVTDIGLIGPLDGVAFAERLRADPRTARIPILAVTGRDPGTFGDRARLFYHVLLKPVLPDDLSGKIRAALLASEALRRRDETARAGIPALLSKSAEVLSRARNAVARRTRPLAVRPCPACAANLNWRARREVDGRLIDEYLPCGNGCGRFWYNHAAGRIEATD